MISKSREQVIDKFFKEFFTWKADNIGMWIVAGFMEVICVGLMCIPFQNMIEEGLVGIAAILAVSGAWYYINPYIFYMDEGKRRRIYYVINYLPVSLKELRIFRLKKVTLFCVKMFLIFLVGQMIFALIFFHGISWGNLIYPFVCGLVAPMVSAAISIWTVA